MKNTKNTEQAKSSRKRELPELTAGAGELIESFADLTPTEQTAFIANAQEQMRIQGVEASNVMRQRAKETDADVFAIGDAVRIVSGDVKNMGAVGTVTKVSRVRAFVNVDGSDRQAYVFLSDLEPIGGIEDVEIDSDDDDETLEETG